MVLSDERKEVKAMSHKTTVMAVVNQKGGTGKTTTCENLGVGLAKEGKKVLLVDTDPQASLTISLGYPRPDDLDITLSDMMAKVMQERPIEQGEGILHHKEGTKLEYLPFHNVPIGVLKVFPGIQFGLFEDIMTEKLSGIVLETFGSGNIPSGGDELFPIIKKAFASGSVVAVCSQCPVGTVTLGTYETSSSLKSAGAVSGKDMTTEAAVAKLYHLFSLELTKEEIKRLMEENIAGELT